MYPTGTNKAIQSVLESATNTNLSRDLSQLVGKYAFLSHPIFISLTFPPQQGSKTCTSWTTSTFSSEVSPRWFVVPTDDASAKRHRFPTALKPKTTLGDRWFYVDLPIELENGEEDCVRIWIPCALPVLGSSQQQTKLLLFENRDFHRIPVGAIVDDCGQRSVCSAYLTQKQQLLYVIRLGRAGYVSDDDDDDSSSPSGALNWNRELLDLMEVAETETSTRHVKPGNVSITH